MKDWLYEYYENAAPCLSAVFGGVLMATGYEVEGAIPSLVWILLGGLCIVHGVETSAIRAAAKAEQRFSRKLIDTLMDGRDVKITVTHEGKQ